MNFDSSVLLDSWAMAASPLPNDTFTTCQSTIQYLRITKGPRLEDAPLPIEYVFTTDRQVKVRFVDEEQKQHELTIDPGIDAKLLNQYMSISHEIESLVRNPNPRESSVDRRCKRIELFETQGELLHLRFKDEGIFVSEAMASALIELFLGQAATGCNEDLVFHREERADFSPLALTAQPA